MSKTYPEKDYLEQCSPYVLDVRALLMRWFEALEASERTGQPIPWLPDPSGVLVSEELAAKVVAEIEDYCWTREKGWMAHCDAGRGGPYEAGPGFDRLPYPQRVALIQEWSAIKRKHAAAEADRPVAEAQRFDEMVHRTGEPVI